MKSLKNSFESVSYDQSFEKLSTIQKIAVLWAHYSNLELVGK